MKLSRLSLSRATFSGFFLSLLPILSTEAAPTGAQVSQGSASFHQNGNITTIHASNGAVINYSGFNIGKGETVDFIQPGSHSRVLNRVFSSDPTKIFGSLESNGIVYLVNPNGIYFQNGSMVNVGHLYAAAGHLSDTDFLSGKNRFSDLTGDVQNSGQILAGDSVHLFGEHVANFGSITAQNGMVVMAAGPEVLVGQRDSHIFVRASGQPGAAPASTSTTVGVQNAGSIQAPRAILGAGDMYSVAISNTGIIKSKQIAVSGGSTGAVNVSGTLDASSAQGKGGSIQVTGHTVALQGATLDASGALGGGTVQVGGGFHGQGNLPAATQTTVDAASTIKANATVSGTGGQVVVWSSQATQFGGQIEARGAGTGNGGVAEVSSVGQLSYTGHTDLTAAGGKIGTLLLDPTDIEIVGSGTSNTPFVGGEISFLAEPTPPPVSTTSIITAADLISQLSSSNVILQADNDITFQVGLTSTSTHSLTLQAGHSIVFGDTSAVTISLAGNLIATAHDSGAIGGAKTGAAITMTQGGTSTIDTTGGASISFTNSGGGIALGVLNAGTGPVTLSASGSVTQGGALTASGLLLHGTGGTFTLTNNGNTVSTIASDANGSVAYFNNGALTVGTVGGVNGITNTSNSNISLQTAGTLTLSQALDAGTAAAGGVVTLNSSGAVTQGASGKISGGSLLLSGGGVYTLTGTTNTVGTLASDATAAVSYTNNAGLTVGTVGSVAGVTNTTGAAIVLDATGGLTINQALSNGTAGSASQITLTATGAGTVSEGASGSISAGSLLLHGTEGYTLSGSSNTVGTIASDADSPVTFKNSVGLTVGTVGGVSGISNTGNDSITLSTTGNLAINQQLSSGTAAVVLTVSGTATQGSSGTITGGSLLLHGTGTYDLSNTGNDVGTLAGDGSGPITYDNGGNLSVGTVGGVAGVQNTGNSDISLNVAGTLTLNQLLSAGTAASGGQVTLTASGAVTEAGAGAISAGSLLLHGAGAYTLTGTTNTVGTLASDASAGVSFTNHGALTVGTVGGVSGISNATNSLIVLTTAGDLTLNQAVNNGTAASTGQITLNATGTVTQGASGALSSGSLLLGNSGTFTLTNASNDVGTIASNANGAVAYFNNGALTVGTVGGVNGVTNTSNANISLQTAGTLTLNQAVNAGTAAAGGVVTLNSSGAVTQGASGDISGGSLLLRGAGVYTLTGTANTVGTLASDATAAVSYTNNAALTVGTVGSVSGVTNTTGAAIVLDTTGGLAINQALSNGAAGSASQITLTATGAGSVSEGAGGSISAGSLLLHGTQAYNLSGTSNTVGTLASDANASVTYKNSVGLTVGTVGGVSGISNTGNDSISLITTGDLAINQQLSSGTAPVVLTVSGTATQGSSGTITAGSLLLRGAGTYDLTNTGNDVGTLAGDGSGPITYDNGANLSVGTVNGVVGIQNTGNANISLNVAGTLTLNQLLSAGSAASGGQVTLTATGAVTESGGAISAGSLLLHGAGAYTLTGTTNTVGTLASDASAGVSFTNNGALTVGTVGGVSGISNATNSPIVLKTVGDLTLNQAVNNGTAASTGQITLNATGTVTQGSSGTLDTGSLLLQNSGTFTLTNSGNSVGTIASSASGPLDFHDGVSLSVGTVGGVNGIANGSTSGVTLLTAGTLTVNQAVTTGGGTIDLDATGGNVVLASDVNAGAGNVLLTSSNTITEPGGVITAGLLTVQAPNSVKLTGANEVQSLDASVTASGATFYFVNAGSLAVGAAGIQTANGDIGLQSGGTLQVGSINAGSGTVRLVADGNISETASGAIVAGALGVENSGGNTVLDKANQIGSSGFAADSSFAGGTIVVNNTGAGGLKIDSVSAPAVAVPNFTFNSITGVTTTAGGGTNNISLTTTGNLNLLQNVSAPGADVLLSAANQVVQSGATTVDSSGLAVISALTPILSASNTFDTLAARITSAGQGFSVVRNTGFTVGDVLGVTGVSTQGGTIDLETLTGALVLSSSVNATKAGAVELVAQGDSVTETGAGKVVSNTLVVNALDTTALNGANDVNTLAASVNTGGDDFSFNDSSALTVGTVAGVTGVTVQNANITLTSGGALAVDAGLGAGTGTVQLVSHGELSQSTGGGITAGSLGASNLGTTGDIALNTVANQIGTSGTAGIVAAVNDAAGGTIAISGANGVSVGTVGTVAGVTTTAGSGTNNVSLSAGGTLDLAQNVSAPGGSVLLTGSMVSESTGVVQAHGLAIVASQAVDFTGANAIDVLAGSVTGAALPFSFTSPQSFAVGTVLGVTGVTTNSGRIGLTADAGNLTVAAPVNAGGNVVDLAATLGAVNESGSGTVTSEALLVQAAGSSDLTGANAIGDLAAQITGAGASLSFRNTGDLTLTSFLTSSGLVDGISTDGGDVNLRVQGAFSLNDPIAAGIGTVRLVADSNITGSGAITAQSLSVSSIGTSPGQIALTGANAVTTVAGANDASGGDLLLNLSGNGIIGSVSGFTASGYTFGPFNGLTVNGAGHLGVTTGGTLAIENVVSATGGVAYLVSQGDITESGPGAIDAATLGVENEAAGAGNIILTGSNIIGSLGASDTGNAGNQIHIVTSSGPLTVTDVPTFTADGATFFTNANGVATAGGPVTLESGGALLVKAPVVSPGGNVQLTSSGDMRESGAGRITAKLLGITNSSTSGGNILLLGSNTVNSVSGSNAFSGGNLEFFDAGSLAVGSAGLTVAGGGSISLNASGNLAVTGVLNATEGGVQLTAGAYLSETVGPSVMISAKSLEAQAGTGIALGGANTVSSLQASTSHGDLDFIDRNNLDVTGASAPLGTVTITSLGSLSSSGPILANNAISLTGQGKVSIGDSITSANGGAITLAVADGRGSISDTGDVKTTGAFTATTQGEVALTGSVKAGAITVSGKDVEAGDADAVNGDLSLQASGELFLDGTHYSGDNVHFNDEGSPRALDPLASIILTNTGTTTIDAGSSFAVGYHQNLLSFGSLTINADTATIGDTAARGALNISANNVVLQDREPDGSSFQGRHDRGLNVVANSIDFGGASVSFSGQGNGKAFFAVAQGLPNVDRISGISFFVDAQLNEQFTSGFQSPNGHLPASEALPFQPLTGGSVDAEVVAALAGALPELKPPQNNAETTLSAAAVTKLLSLGVNARDPDEEEKKGIKARRALFKQLIAKSTLSESDYKVVVNRIAPGQVNLVLKTYDRIMGAKEELKPGIEQLFSAEYAKYEEKTSAEDASGFGAYLVGAQAKDAQARNALAVIGQFRELFTQLGKIGLTPKEVEISEDVVARSLQIDGLTADDFLTLVGTPHRAPAPAGAAPAPAPAPAPAAPPQAAAQDSAVAPS